MGKQTFLYFAYGSNLLAKRIHINNPSAVRVAPAKLENYRLDFVRYSTRWKGASATIVPTEGTAVWGALWEINLAHMQSLDQQEGVDHQIYFPLEVTVQMLDGSTTTCRVYQQHLTPEYIPNIEHLPEDRWPSQVYLNTMLEGAKETELPEEYLQFLRKIPHNSYNNEPEIMLNLSDAEK